MPTLDLRCTCGTIRGSFDAVPTTAVRGLCYCLDCRAANRHLDRPDLLDSFGGTEVVPTWPARVRFTDGADRICLLRLRPNGLHRWYAGCCRMPIANTLGSPRMPFTGLLRCGIAADDATLDALYGKAHGIQGRFAVGGCPPGAYKSASPAILFGAVRLLASGWWAGAHAPSPWFGADGAPIVAARVLTEEERAAAYG